ncbi:hypothetical protein [Shouchella clausii]|jgi:hypothetical protein|uniref:Uncharacterized protein n=2 Tax=Shouchella clausii TaxID=79880 RepID=A0A268S2V4_SHOCL|nr:hypothetical protein [Shouchella clausii]AST97080.1 hypothetical protein BC8716_14415 [Shouchella clausii]MBU8594618.1 hypothetical protein [Shouchella clausii]MCR1286580.1 hypothetical protein [Shouchella clausii]MCY1104729.1 hypothetical protein [Shouchella clausii]MEB5473897.1 hypothetical protein [Shouchella clausii]
MTKYNQAEYNARWIEKNKEHKKYLSYRSTARTFVRKHATAEDIYELRKLLDQRELGLKKDK